MVHLGANNGHNLCVCVCDQESVTDFSKSQRLLYHHSLRWKAREVHDIPLHGKGFPMTGHWCERWLALIHWSQSGDHEPWDRYSCGSLGKIGAMRLSQNGIVSNVLWSKHVQCEQRSLLNSFFVILRTYMRSTKTLLIAQSVLPSRTANRIDETVATKWKSSCSINGT